jgi:hypothetical protein
MRQHRLFVAILTYLFFANAARAHAPIQTLPIHHATIFLTKSLVSRVGAHSTHGFFFFHSSNSLATQTAIANSLHGLLNKPLSQFIHSAIIAGQATGFTGGAVTSGVLQGTLYIPIPFGPPPPPFYLNAGEYTATVGTNIPANFVTSNASPAGSNSRTPNFQNSLNFAPPSAGGQFAGPGRFSGTWRHSFLLGQKLGAPGPVTGGLFVGTAYRNSLGSSTYTSSTFNFLFPSVPSASYIFAFGNNPLNNPAGLNTSLFIPNQASYVQFANGLRNVTNGQILYPMFSQLPPGFQNGSVLTIAGNPANTGIVNRTLSNLSSFLFF